MVKNWKEWAEETRAELERAFAAAERKEGEAGGFDAGEEPTEDMKKNPDNYYVWHCAGDDKVRSSHFERDGRVFCRDNPPEGGHPGEDYNCRCEAEEYRYEKSESKEQNEKGLLEEIENATKIVKNYFNFDKSVNMVVTDVEKIA